MGGDAARLAERSPRVVLAAVVVPTPQPGSCAGGSVLPLKLPSLRPPPGQPGGRRGGRPPSRTVSGPDPGLGPSSSSQCLPALSPGVPAPLPVQPGQTCSESAFPGRRAGPYFIPVDSPGPAWAVWLLNAGGALVTRAAASGNPQRWWGPQRPSGQPPPPGGQKWTLMFRAGPKAGVGEGGRQASNLWARYPGREVGLRASQVEG